MKKIILLSIVSVLITNFAIGQEQSTLINGTIVPVRILSNINSNSKVEQDIVAIVDRDITDSTGENVLISRGTPVTMIADIQRARGVGKPGSIKLTALQTTAVNGRTIALMGNYAKEGQSRKGVALGVGLGVGLCVCTPCLFCLCIKGEKAEIPEGTILHNVLVNGVYKIGVDK